MSKNTIGISPLVVLACLVGVSCSMVPLASLEEQKAQILRGEIRLKTVTSQAFVEAWGRPPYFSQHRTQFYPLRNGNLLPQFRVPLGEAPPNWDTGVVSEKGVFFGYDDRGELLGFLQGLLVYREQVSPDEVRAVGKEWGKNRLFQTNMERTLQKQR